METRKSASVLASSVLAASLAWGAVYVDVETEEGTFTIEVDAEARNGGAAFLGLAEGWTDWVDARTGEPQRGKRYFEGTWMNWAMQDEGGETILLGDFGRMFPGADGEEKWNNGSGAEMADDVTGKEAMPARSVAMLQKAAISPWEWMGDTWPTMAHSLDGRWGVAVKDAGAHCGGRWSRVGTVVSNWGVVEALAARAGAPAKGGETGMAKRHGRVRGARGTDATWRVMASPAEVKGTRVHGDAGEIEAWRALAGTKAATCGRGEVGLEMDPGGGGGTLRCRMEGKGQYAISHTTNLLDKVWNLNWMDWSEGDGGGEQDVWFSTAPEAFGPRRHFAATTVGYPELAGPDVAKAGTYVFRTLWEKEDQVFHYQLDVGAATGMVWELDAATQSTALRSAPVSGVEVMRSGAHNTRVGLLIDAWTQAPYYWLGEENAGAGRGRFRMWDAAGGGETWGEWRGEGRDVRRQATGDSGTRGR